MSVLKKDQFVLPEGVIYLDGNSLGPLPKAAAARVQEMIADEWGEMLIRGWNQAGWMEQPTRVGNMVAGIVGTPPVIQLTALEVAMGLWTDVDMQELRAASIALQEQFIEEIERDVPQLTLASPRNSAERGSQVSFRFEEGYAAMQAVIDRGVIGDFRAPDIMRFGFTPLYIDAEDVSKAVAIIRDVMENRLWDNEKYKTRARVT